MRLGCGCSAILQRPIVEKRNFTPPYQPRPIIPIVLFRLYLFCCRPVVLERILPHGADPRQNLEKVSFGHSIRPEEGNIGVSDVLALPDKRLLDSCQEVSSDGLSRAAVFSCTCRNLVCWRCVPASLSRLGLEDRSGWPVIEISLIVIRN